MSISPRIIVTAAVTLCLLLAAMMIWEYVETQKFGGDFSVYWTTVNQPAELAYAGRARGPFPYAPTMLLFISPLALIPKWPGYFLLGIGGIAALALACRPYLSKAAIALSIISPPMVRCLRNGQISAVLAALLIWACGSKNRIAAGVAFGTIAPIKPQLVLMAPLMFVLNRDWKAFWSAGVTFLLAILAAVLIFGPARWPEWIASMDHFHFAVSASNIIDIAVSPAAVAEKFGLPPLPFLLLGVVAGAALVYVFRDTEGLEKATVIGAASLLAAPYSLAYDLVVVVPFLAAMIVKGRVAAFVAIAGMLNPLPLVLTAYELVLGRSKREGYTRPASAAR